MRIDYVDDYCFDCKVMCKQADDEHKEHDTLAKRTSPPDLGVNVSDGVGTEDKFGG